MNAHRTFLDGLLSSPNLQKVKSEDESDVTIAFVAVVSRAGTDIEAALQKVQGKNINYILAVHFIRKIIHFSLLCLFLSLPATSATQPVVLVVLHHTTEQDPVVPNSSRSVNRRDVFTVDCLFNEDRGLLSCQHNDEALKAVKDHLGLVDGRPPKVSQLQRPDMIMKFYLIK